MTGEGQIRRARRDECARLSDLAFRSKASWGYSAQFMAQCRAELTVGESDIRDDDFFVLEFDGEIIGFCALRSRGDGEGELADVFIAPSHLRAGYGRRLLEHAKRAARARGWRSLRIEADPNALVFYRRCRGEQIGTVASGSIPGRRLPLVRIHL